MEAPNGSTHQQLNRKEEKTTLCVRVKWCVERNRLVGEIAATP